MTQPLQLLPAVDVAGGRAVQPPRSDPASARRFGDPVKAALRWQAAGAEWVHLVDLDAAFGRGSNREIMKEVAAVLDIDLEVSGGISDDESLDFALRIGCRRAILSTAALSDRRWVGSSLARHGDRIAVALDVRGETLAPRGSTSGDGDLWEALARLDTEGCQRYVVTDVTRDGALMGPNKALLRQVCARTSAPIVASGGVSTLEDLKQLAAITSDGLEGVIVGTALYTGAFTLEEALRAVADVPSAR